MGRTILALVVAIILAFASLGFTIWLGLAVLVVTVGQPNEPQLDVLLVIAIAVALALGIWVGRRIATRA